MPEPTEPHEYTAEECRDKFLTHLAGLVEHWANESRAPSALEKLNGLAFSMLVLLDGGSGMMPAFDVYPSPHEEDAEFNREMGNSWWPEDVPLPLAMHEMWDKFAPKVSQ